MNLTAYNAKLIDDLTAELSRASPEKPKREPERPTDWYEYPIEGLDWCLHVGYRWSRDCDGVVDVDICALDLEQTETRAVVPVPLALLFGRDRWRIADEIAGEIEAREQAAAAERHPSWCRCRDCRDDRGDWEYHSRQDDQA